MMGTPGFFKKIAMAEKFCNGNMEKAKRLVSGDFNDILIIKGRFNDAGESFYGFFQSFYSKIFYSLTINHVALTNYTVASQNKPINDWYSFYTRIDKVMKEADYDRKKGIELNSKMKEIFDIKTVIGIIEFASINDITSLTNSFTDYVSRVMGTPVEVDLDYEDTNSLMLNEKWGYLPPEKPEK